MYLSVKEAVEVYRKGCRSKCEASAERIIGKSILAGVMIAMGAAASSVAAHNIANIVGGVCFVGLPLYYLNREKPAVKMEKEETENGRYTGRYVRSIVR